MKLAEWRRKAGLTQQELADQLGCIVTTVARYESGIRVPENPIMLKIYEVSRGEVQPNDFFELPALGPASPERKAA